MPLSLSSTLPALPLPQTVGYMYARGGAKELGKTFKTLGVGWAWEVRAPVQCWDRLGGLVRML